MRYLILTILMGFNYLATIGQTLIQIGDVERLPTNMQASINQRIGADGLPCGLLMVNSTVPNLEFKGKIVGEVSYSNSIYLVYLQSGSTSVNIINKTGKTLKLKFPKIEPKVTYRTIVAEDMVFGSVKISTIPSGASVHITDGNNMMYLGKTPINSDVKVIEGRHRFIISKENYESNVVTVDIKGNKVTDLGKIDLIPQQVRNSSKENKEILIANRKQQQEESSLATATNSSKPITDLSKRVSDSTKPITSSPKWESPKTEVGSSKGAAYSPKSVKNRMEPTLNIPMGKLRIFTHIERSTARVGVIGYIYMINEDGTELLLGETLGDYGPKISNSVPIPVGVHQIIVRASGCKDLRIRVNIKENQTELKFITLEEDKVIDIRSQSH